MAIGPLGRVVAQLLIAGGSVLGRAFVEAYRQALVNARRGGGGGAAAGAASVLRSRAGKMSLEEASNILNLRPANHQNIKFSVADVEEQFKKIMNHNSEENGGSAYVRAKIANARNALLEVSDKDDINNPSKNSSDASNDK